jgi:hypothetical protein
MRFSAESIRRNPTADLGGGTSFVVSDLFASRARAIVFRLLEGRATLMTVFFELFGDACVSAFGRRAIESDEWFVGIAASPIPNSSGREKWRFRRW